MFPQRPEGLILDRIESSSHEEEKGTADMLILDRIESLSKGKKRRKFKYR